MSVVNTPTQPGEDRSLELRLPNRYVFSSSDRPLLGPFGFLADPSATGGAPISDLLSPGFWFVVAPPWYGKSFTARALRAHAETNGRYCRWMCFETPCYQIIPDQSWRDWIASDNPGTWIIDALDEAVTNCQAALGPLLNELITLASSAMSRLAVVIFCRQNEIPERFYSELRDAISKRVGGDGVKQRVLGPLDETEATRICRSKDRFEQVCRTIATNRLSAFGGIPAVLSYLSRLEGSEPLSARDIWFGILKKLLSSRRGDNESRSQIFSIDEQFEATSRIGCALAVSQDLGLVSKSETESALSIDDLFQMRTPDYHRKRQAAAEALRSAAFIKEGNGYRFAQRHLRDWFAAAHLASLSVPHLRQLLLDTSGRPLDSLRSVQVLLAQIASDTQVKQWMREQLGEPIPPSDAFPWSLDDATQALARVEQLTLQAPMGLHFGFTDYLNNFAIVGMSPVLVARIENSELDTRIRKLAIDVAIAIRAAEVCEAAANLVLNPHAPMELRIYAAILLRREASDDQLRHVQPLTLPSWDSEEHEELAAILMMGLLERNLVDLLEVIGNAPNAKKNHGVVLSLWEFINSRVDLQVARRIVDEINWPDLGSQTELRYRARRRRVKICRDTEDVIWRSLTLLATQPDPPEADLDRLIRAVLAGIEGLLVHTDSETDLLHTIAQQQQARRELMKGLIIVNDPEQPLRLYVWHRVLKVEDSDWLIDQVGRKHSPPTWLLELALWLARDSACPSETRLRLHEMVKKYDENAIVRFNTRIDAINETDKKYRRASQQREARRRKNQRSIAKIVESLMVEGLDKSHQFHMLAWCCFSPDYVRPSNLIGTWSDLPDELKTRVLEIIESYLKEGEPHPIPDGTEFPGAIIQEGDAFVAWVRYRSGMTIPGDVISKWLPASLVYIPTDRADILLCCLNSNISATNEVICRLLCREMRLSREHLFYTSWLPRECWTDEVCRHAGGLIKATTDNLYNRIGLLRILHSRHPDSARPIIEEWIRGTLETYEASDAQRITAIDLMLANDPSRAMKLLVEYYSANATATLMKLQHFSRREVRIAAELERWPEDALEKCCELLYNTFPPSTDPSFEGGVYAVTSNLDLRRARNVCLAVLYKRQSNLARDALSRLAVQHADIRTWIDQQDAETTMVSLLATTSEKSGGPKCLTVEAVLNVLDDNQFFLVRSSEHLLELLIEEINEIETSIAQHCGMLRRHRLSKSKSRPKAHLNEDALQAYFACRLNDRLPRRTRNDIKCHALERESLGANNTKRDLIVQCATDAGDAAYVVIEIKWACNSEVATSLIEQLGNSYLVQGNRSHGIYLVAMCEDAKWPSARGWRHVKRPRLEHWKRALLRQATAFNSKNLGKRVVPVLIDCICISNLTGRLQAKRKTVKTGIRKK